MGQNIRRLHNIAKFKIVILVNAKFINCILLLIKSLTCLLFMTFAEYLITLRYGSMTSKLRKISFSRIKLWC